MAPAGIAIIATIKISERIGVMDIVENILFLLSNFTSFGLRRRRVVRRYFETLHSRP